MPWERVETGGVGCCLATTLLSRDRQYCCLVVMWRVLLLVLLPAVVASGYACIDDPDSETSDCINLDCNGASACSDLVFEASDCTLDEAGLCVQGGYNNTEEVAAFIEVLPVWDEASEEEWRRASTKTYLDLILSALNDQRTFGPEITAMDLLKLFDRVIPPACTEEYCSRPKPDAYAPCYYLPAQCEGKRQGYHYYLGSWADDVCDCEKYRPELVSK
ncbi:MAG: hypothetical protein HC888_02280 [Candidatus Competibacteraceae bacterium]|nr:hypothetical protein [Candidatus Competibacteraceae bacterium]